jgi:hypothetical protein
MDDAVDKEGYSSVIAMSFKSRPNGHDNTQCSCSHKEMHDVADVWCSVTRQDAIVTDLYNTNK